MPEPAMARAAISLMVEGAHLAQYKHLAGHAVREKPVNLTQWLTLQRHVGGGFGYAVENI